MIKRIPSFEDFQNFNGAHCHSLWESLDEQWKCPGCDRTKFQVLRWTKRYVKAGKKVPPYDDWMAVINTHHDHSQGYCDFKRGRFAETVICGQCNSADGRAKKMLNLPENFSFSPSEIRQFISSEPHGKHKINIEVARQIYDKICRAH
jgi:hypothetical protein